MLFRSDYWYADLDEIYVKYVSNDANFGGDIGDWPATFTEYVKSYFAYRIVFSLTSDKQRHAMVQAELDNRLTTAKNRDAMAGPARFPASGSWTRSRRGGRRGGSFGDGGTTGSLTG